MTFVLPIALGIGVGMVVRVLYLWRGHRMFPTYPHGLIIHLFLGFIAATLGALAVAALASGNLTAGVFLAIGTAQFHTIRDLERSYMAELDKDQLVPRGPSYVEGMATAFEARNFLIFAVAALTTAGARWLHPGLAVGAGVVLGIVLSPLVEGPLLGDLAEVRRVAIAVRDGRIWVGEVPLHALAAEDEPLWRQGLALEIVPRSFRAWQALRSPGQMQAILHDLTELLGRRDGRDTFWPLAFVQGEARRLIVATVPDRPLAEDDLARVATFTVVESAYPWRRRR